MTMARSRGDASTDLAGWALALAMVATVGLLVVFWRVFVLAIRALFAAQQALCDRLLAAFGQEDAGPLARLVVTLAMFLALDVLVAVVAVVALQPAAVVSVLVVSVLVALASALVPGVVSSRGARGARSPRWWD